MTDSTSARRETVQAQQDLSTAVTVILPNLFLLVASQETSPLIFAYYVHDVSQSYKKELYVAF